MEVVTWKSAFSRAVPLKLFQKTNCSADKNLLLSWNSSLRRCFDLFRHEDFLCRPKMYTSSVTREKTHIQWLGAASCDCSSSTQRTFSGPEWDGEWIPLLNLSGAKALIILEKMLDSPIVTSREDVNWDRNPIMLRRNPYVSIFPPRVII